MKNSLLKKYDNYVVGYYGMRNTGDDALMLSTLLGLSNESNSTGVNTDNGAAHQLVSSASENIICTAQTTPVVLSEAPAFRGQNRLKHYLAACRASRIVFGGGSVLHSAADINMKRHLMALSSQKNSRAIGVGIEAFKTTKDEIACKRFLNECGFIGVRDKASFDIATSIAPHANVKQTFDLAPTLICHPKYRPETTAKRGIVLNVCPVSIDAFGNVDEQAETARVALFAKLIESLWIALKEPVYVISFNGHSQFGDNILINRVLKTISAGIPVSFIDYCADPIATLNLMSTFKVAITMRLHATMFAYLANTPVLSINYHPKCSQICNQLGIQNEYQHSTNELVLNTLINTVVKGINRGFKKPGLALENAAKMSQLNWSNDYEYTKNISCNSAL